MVQILIAAGDESMRAHLTRTLARAGHDVAAVRSGAEALERIRHEPYDLLLSDIGMPEIDGIALAQRVAAMRPTMRVMFITGFAGLTLDYENGRGAPPTLSAPFHLRDLAQEIDRVLALGSASER